MSIMPYGLAAKKHSPNTGVLRASIGLACCVVSGMAWGGATAVGKLGWTTDSSLFLFNSASSGSNCVSVVAGPIANPPKPGDSPCNIDVDFYTVNGRGNAKPKARPSTTSSFSNSASFAGTTSTGVATWTYTFGSLVDEANYTASSNIAPAPPPVFPPKYVARASATDPIAFDLDSDQLIGVEGKLQGLDLQIDEPLGSGNVGLGSDYSLDDMLLYDFHIIVPAGFKDIHDIDIYYESILGPSFDATMIANLEAALSLDSLTGSVNLGGSFDLFPRMEFLLAAGSHSMAGGIVSNAELQAVPEPASLGLLALGVGLLLKQRRCAKGLS